MDSGKCSSCGAPLGAGARSGLCPKCFLPDISRPRTTEDAAAAVLQQGVLQGGGRDSRRPAAGAGAMPPLSEVAGGWQGDPLDGEHHGAGESPLRSPEDGKSFWPDTGPAPHIEGYEVLRPLKQGGQGIVYLAVQRSTKRKVAIKVLLAGAFASKSARRRFEREIELVAGFKHPNVIAVFDSGTTPDRHAYCVMDYVRGLPLTHYVREHGLGLKQVLALFATTCEAVNHAHQRGVIHRDLKPSNILVDVDGNARVLDFGLAKTLSEPAESGVSVTGSIHGTYPYMSPEQTRGNPDEMDTRTDVYSLGVILYEALTGRFPYPVDGTIAEVVRHIGETPPTPPAQAWTAHMGVRPDRVARRGAGGGESRGGRGGSQSGG
jgi:serine/threonine protein kinase